MSRTLLVIEGDALLARIVVTAIKRCARLLSVRYTTDLKSADGSSDAYLIDATIEDSIPRAWELSGGAEVWLMSGYTRAKMPDGMAEDLRDWPPDRFIEKPFDIAAAVSAIEGVLRDRE